jgi:iron complex outermembrane receptor protein
VVDFATADLLAEVIFRKAVGDLLGTTTDLAYGDDHLVSGSEGMCELNGLCLSAGLPLQLSGNWQNSQYKGDTAIDGKTVQREPSFQYAFSPSYGIPVGGYPVGVYSGYSRIGSCWADQANQQLLPTYETRDLGVLAELGNNPERRVNTANGYEQARFTEANSGFAAGIVTVSITLVHCSDEQKEPQ